MRITASDEVVSRPLVGSSKKSTVIGLDEDFFFKKKKQQRRRRIKLTAGIADEFDTDARALALATTEVADVRVCAVHKAELLQELLRPLDLVGVGDRWGQSEAGREQDGLTRSEHREEDVVCDTNS